MAPCSTTTNANDIQKTNLFHNHILSQLPVSLGIPEVYSSHFWIRESGLREAVNAPIQSGAQGIIKEAMGQLIPIYRVWSALGYIVRPLLQIHDELLWEVEDCILDAVIPMLKHTMEDVVELSVPVKVNVKVGLNWNQMDE